MEETIRMSILNNIFKRSEPAPAPAPQSTVGIITGGDLFKSICTGGYTSLDRNPEVISACKKIADLIATMTIHLMSNTENGDQRIVNELSRKIDINPHKYMTRKDWMSVIVMNLLLYGDGNSIVIPKTESGLLGDLQPIKPSKIRYKEIGDEYRVIINNTELDPENLLHFKLNPDEDHPWKGRGFRMPLREVTDNLSQAAATEKGFLTDKWKPSVIIKVDGNVNELAGKEGREKILEEYVATSEAGQPWLIPAEMMDVTTIKPLTLGDLAIKDTIEINKRTVATILGVPPFIVGAGTYDDKEWNNFINSTILPIATGIQQEMTRKLLLNPKWYFKFNISSLYSYDIKTLSDVYSNLYVRGIVDGNEVRDKLGMSPREGLSELVILENYIPLEKVGDQLKLKQEGESNE